MANNEEYLSRISKLLTPDEIQDLVEAIETVAAYRNGYGVITMRIEKQRVKQLEITSTVRPTIGR